MTVTVQPGARWGRVRVPASKSQAHRLLLCAALGEGETELLCGGLSADIRATVECLRALGAGIRQEGERLWVKPIRSAPRSCRLPCGESGSTLRFLLPQVGALGTEGAFLRRGRLPQRPLSPLDEALRAHGMQLWEEGEILYAGGKLTPGDYTLPGDVSSQFISGLLMALPRLPGDSRLTVTGPLESAGYVAMTEDALGLSGIRWQRSGQTWAIPGGQRFHLPRLCRVEGDWSGAAFFLCAGALSRRGITVEGLSLRSAQGDRAVVQLLRRFGAEITERESAVTVRRGVLHGITVDAAPIPDLIPALSVVAAASVGDTRIENARRLRDKESDRLRGTAALLRALGANVEEGEDSLLIHGRGGLRGGSVDPSADHRLAMAAAIAACACREGVTVKDSRCVEKSYPKFWEDLRQLKGEEL